MSSTPLFQVYNVFDYFLGCGTNIFSSGENCKQKRMDLGEFDHLNIRVPPNLRFKTVQTHCTFTEYFTGVTGFL